MPRNWKKCLHIFIKNKQFKKRQCVTLEEILNTDQAKQRGLGGGPVCFFERDAKPLDCSKVNFDEFWTYLNNIFWCHTLTHSTIFRRLPPKFAASLTVIPISTPFVTNSNCHFPCFAETSWTLFSWSLS